eukprot:COSAG04_NODE_217_length_19889_cov_59.963221_4_plen_211_part_00
MAARWLDWSRSDEEEGHWRNNEVANVYKATTSDTAVAICFGSFWLIVLAIALPLRLYRRLKREQRDDLLREPAVFARLGYLYERFRDEAFYYELLCLEFRFLLIMAGTLLSSPTQLQLPRSRARHRADLDAVAPGHGQPRAAPRDHAETTARTRLVGTESRVGTRIRVSAWAPPPPQRATLFEGRPRALIQLIALRTFSLHSQSRATQAP